MKNYIIKNSVFILLLCIWGGVFSQTLTPAFSLKIAFEDKAKHKDTITIGYDSLATNGLDPMFGENLAWAWSVPWDSLFEVRTLNSESMSVDLNKRDIVKQTSHPTYCYQSSVPYHYLSAIKFGILFRCKWNNFPVKITWDYTKLSGSSCHAWSAIIYNCKTSEPSLFPVHRMNLPYGVFNLQTPTYYSDIAGENGYRSYVSNNVLSPGGIVADTVYEFELVLSSQFDVFDNTIFTNSIQDQTVSKLESKVYPNPAHHEVVVSCAEPAWYRMYDLSGKQVYQAYHFAGDNIIDVSHIPKGLYMMHIEGKNSRFSRQKILIE